MFVTLTSGITVWNFVSFLDLITPTFHDILARTQRKIVYNIKIHTHLKINSVKTKCNICYVVHLYFWDQCCFIFNYGQAKLVETFIYLYFMYQRLNTQKKIVL